ncbi:hypothetical protein E5288_WYG013744 [Bos mutus]|uniref:Uncharacterized protein n=1 Tax=Bos mutus TaxID=72004 RepID=A0A6B0QQY0_9CETA|nr:hypothetical protein [Bos mutus]
MSLGKNAHRSQRIQTQSSPGPGGIRAVVCPLGAYSLQECGSQKQTSLFNCSSTKCALCSLCNTQICSKYHQRNLYELLDTDQWICLFHGGTAFRVGLPHLRRQLVSKHIKQRQFRKLLLLLGIINIVERPGILECFTKCCIDSQSLVAKGLNSDTRLLHFSAVKHREDEVFPKNHRLCFISVHHRDLKDENFLGKLAIVEDYRKSIKECKTSTLVDYLICMYKHKPSVKKEAFIEWY